MTLNHPGRSQPCLSYLYYVFVINMFPSFRDPSIKIDNVILIPDKHILIVVVLHAKDPRNQEIEKHILNS